jgi:hypothetical protein
MKRGNKLRGSIRSPPPLSRSQRSRCTKSKEHFYPSEPRTTTRPEWSVSCPILRCTMEPTDRWGRWQYRMMRPQRYSTCSRTTYNLQLARRLHTRGVRRVLLVCPARFVRLTKSTRQKRISLSCSEFGVNRLDSAFPPPGFSQSGESVLRYRTGMGNAPTRNRASDLYESIDVVITPRSSPMGDDVLVLLLGPVLAMSGSFDCNVEGERRESVRTEALQAAQAQCAMLGGNCILEAKAEVTPVRENGKGSRAKDCYVVSGTACIVKRSADQAKAPEHMPRSDRRIRDVPATRKQAPPQTRQFDWTTMDGQLRQEPRHNAFAAVRRAGGLLNFFDGFDTDANWSFRMFD